METDLQGAALMAKLRQEMPGASIDAVLDAARLINVRRTARDVAARSFDTVLHLLAHLGTLKLTDEDLETLTRVLVELVPSDQGRDLEMILEAKLLGRLITSVDRLGTQRPRRRPWRCWCRPSPDTDR